MTFILRAVVLTLLATAAPALAADVENPQVNASALTQGTLAAARGGTGEAGTLTGARRANGASADTQAASTDLSDVTAPTVWSLSDGSGAGLTFTSVTTLYTKINKTVTVSFRLVFPSTANASTVAIAGLPVAASSSGPGSGAFTIGVCSSTAASNTIMTLFAAAGTTTLTPVNIAGAVPTNVNLSLATLACTAQYISN